MDRTIALCRIQCSAPHWCEKVFLNHIIGNPFLNLLLHLKKPSFHFKVPFFANYILTKHLFLVSSKYGFEGKNRKRRRIFLMVFSPLESREGKSKNSFVLRWRQLAAEGRRTAMFSGTIVVTVEKPQLLSSQFPPSFLVLHKFL